MLAWLERYGIPPVIVLTKCDKLSRNERNRHAALIATALQRDRSMLFPFSALSKEGRDGIWGEIERLLGIEGPSP
jgi:GTP-binding protein